MSFLLEEAKRITSSDRRRDYSHPLENFTRIAIMWSVYMKTHFTPMDVLWMMILMKGAREANTYKYDNILDVVGYSICAENMSIAYLKMMEMNNNPTQEEVQEGIKILTIITQKDMQDIIDKFNQGYNV